jgi:hypothetical protein
MISRGRRVRAHLALRGSLHSGPPAASASIVSAAGLERAHLRQVISRQPNQPQRERERSAPSVVRFDGDATTSSFRSERAATRRLEVPTTMATSMAWHAGDVQITQGCGITNRSHKAGTRRYARRVAETRATTVAVRMRPGVASSDVGHAAAWHVRVGLRRRKPARRVTSPTKCTAHQN